MKKDNLTSIMKDLAEIAAPSTEIDLWPAIKDSINQGNWHKTKGDLIVNKTIALPKVLLRAAVALLILLAIFGILLATPQGRAFANTIIKLFTTAERLSFPVPTNQSSTPSTNPQTYLLELVPVELTSSPAATLGASDQGCEGAAALTYKCSIESAEASVGFDAWEFPADPQGVTFSSVQAFAAQNEIMITYDVIGGGGYILFTQGMGDPPDNLWSEVPAEAVESVAVGDLPGEFVKGRFTSDGSGVATWNSDAASWRLRWKEGKRWFSIEKAGDPYRIEYLGMKEMIDLATSLVANQQQRISPLRAEYLTSVTDAETISGIDLIEPTLLPEGFRFSYAQYDAQTNSVRLWFYHISTPDYGELMITETPLKYAEQFKEGYYDGEYDQTLSLKINDLCISITFIFNQGNGSRLDETKMTAIAQSLK